MAALSMRSGFFMIINRGISQIIPEMQVLLDLMCKWDANDHVNGRFDYCKIAQLLLALSIDCLIDLYKMLIIVIMNKYVYALESDKPPSA